MDQRPETIGTEVFAPQKADLRLPIGDLRRRPLGRAIVLSRWDGLDRPAGGEPSDRRRTRVTTIAGHQAAELGVPFVVGDMRDIDAVGHGSRIGIVSACR